MRTEAEQLDYEMELLRAQREGREEEFRAEERAKLRTRRLTQLDEEMDDYFRKRDEDATTKDTQTSQEEGSEPKETPGADKQVQEEPQQQTTPSKPTATS